MPDLSPLTDPPLPGGGLGALTNPPTAAAGGAEGDPEDALATLPTKPMRRWTPKTVPELTDPITLKVRDVSFTRGEELPIFNEPMSHSDRLLAFGRMDIRMSKTHSAVMLKLGEVLYDPELGEAWAIVSPSERFADGSLIAIARHQQTLPVGIGD